MLEGCEQSWPSFPPTTTPLGRSAPAFPKATEPGPETRQGRPPILAAPGADDTLLGRPLGNDVEDSIAGARDAARDEFVAWEHLTRGVDFESSCAPE